MKASPLKPGQQVTHVTPDGQHFPATVHSARGDQVKLTYPDGSVSAVPKSSCVIKPHDRRGAPKGNRNASKYGEPTVKRTLRLPVSADERLATMARERGISAASVVAQIVDDAWKA